jgi:hypothetical protein
MQYPRVRHIHVKTKAVNLLLEKEIFTSMFMETVTVELALRQWNISHNEFTNSTEPQGLATSWTARGSNLSGGEFSTPVQTGPGTHPASCTMGMGSLSQGLKRPGRGVKHQPLSSVKVKERVDLRLYFPLGLYGLL